MERQMEPPASAGCGRGPTAEELARQLRAELPETCRCIESIFQGITRKLQSIVLRLKDEHSQFGTDDWGLYRTWSLSPADIMEARAHLQQLIAESAPPHEEEVTMDDAPPLEYLEPPHPSWFL